MTAADRTRTGQATVYNGGAVIGKALDSDLAQDTPLRVIVVAGELIRNRGE